MDSETETLRRKYRDTLKRCAVLERENASLSQIIEATARGLLAAVEHDEAPRLGVAGAGAEAS